MSCPWRVIPTGVLLHVHLQPRAARTRVVGLHGEALKVTLTAPPVANAANSALLAFLAGLLEVPRISVSLVSGEKSREKRVLVSTTNPRDVAKRLERTLLRVDKERVDD
jgi:uncharacterized protein (TIGR00251 family)